MRSRHDTPAPRGSTLLLAMILLLVLSVIGVAAVSLGSAERAGAGVKTQRDALVACAQAAHAVIWGQMGRAGSNYFRSASTVSDITLPDGTKFRAGHYDEASTIINVTGARAIPCKANNTEEFLDLTNRDTFFSLAGDCFLAYARCVDKQGRELEIEFGVNKVF